MNDVCLRRRGPDLHSPVRTPEPARRAGSMRSSGCSSPAGAERLRNGISLEQPITMGVDRWLTY